MYLAMIIEKLVTINKTIFSLQDIATALGIKTSSAAVVCNRYVKKGLLVRIKRGLYTQTEKLKYIEQKELFIIANFLQVPSYVSLMTALSYYGLTTQIQRNFFESISIKRTKRFEVKGFTFNYSKVMPELYYGFEKREGVFIAQPEKALLDSFYFASIGRYSLDVSSIDLKKVNEGALADLFHRFPSKTKKMVEKYYGNITGT